MGRLIQYTKQFGVLGSIKSTATKGITSLGSMSMKRSAVGGALAGAAVGAGVGAVRAKMNGQSAASGALKGGAVGGVLGGAAGAGGHMAAKRWGPAAVAK